MPKPAKIPLLLQLPAAQRDALASWLMEEGITYAEASKRLAKQFGVRAGNSALSVFWTRVCEPRRYAREKREAAEAREGRLLLHIAVRAKFDGSLEITVGGPAAQSMPEKEGRAI